MVVKLGDVKGLPQVTATADFCRVIYHRPSRSPREMVSRVSRRSRHDTATTVTRWATAEQKRRTRPVDADDKEKSMAMDQFEKNSARDGWMDGRWIVTTRIEKGPLEGRQIASSTTLH